MIIIVIITIIIIIRRYVSEAKAVELCPPRSLFSLCSLLLLFSTMSMMKTRMATTRMEVMVTTIFRPPLPDMLSEMGSPIFRSGGMVPGDQHVWTSVRKTVAKAPGFFC